MDQGSVPQPARTGVVFVHGIGTQPPRDTFLDWAEPIVRMLGALRREHDQTAPNEPVGEDPVRDARVEGDRVWAEVEIPAAAGRAADTWVLTEAYWAGQVRAPGLAMTLRYLRERVPSVIAGIANGYGAREPRRKERLDSLIEAAAPGPGGGADPIVRELDRARSGRWAWVDWLDSFWMLLPIRWTLSTVAIVLTLAALGVYAAIRAIPIGAVSRRAELAILDSWLVEWFGDLPVLLDDRVQAAMIRSRLQATIDWLVARNCDRIVIVAHSGGAIVSYSTLLRIADSGFKVAKLITLGQGLTLGWRLSTVAGDLPFGNPLRGDMGAAHPALRWVDFWASYDPAPAGPLAGVTGSPLVAEAAPGPPAGSPIHVESRPVTNLMHMAFDHGAYWANDEGFLVALLRHIDDAGGDGNGSRFYRSAIVRAARIERRRRRVGLLLGWRWLTFAAGLAAVIGAALARGLAEVGTDVASVISLVPGHEWLEGPLAAVGGAVAGFLTIIGRQDVANALADLGPVLLGAAVPVGLARLIYGRGTGTWVAADAVERAKIRGEALGGESEPWARSEATLLVGGLVALVVAAWLGALPIPADGRLIVVATILIATVAISLPVRFWPRPQAGGGGGAPATLSETLSRGIDKGAGSGTTRAA